MKDNKPFWLLHALGPLAVSDSDGGDLKWLGAIVEDISNPMQKVDWRPSGLELKEDVDWKAVPINGVQVLLERASSWSLKAKLAKSIGVEIDESGRVQRNASKRRVVGYRLFNEEDALQRLLDADNHRAKIMPQLSRLTTKRWLIVGFLVAKPAEEDINGKPTQENSDEQKSDQVDQNDSSGSEAGCLIDPLLGASTAMKLPTAPLDLQIKRNTYSTREVSGEAAVSHIFAIVYRSLRREVFCSGISVSNRLRGDMAFDAGPDSASDQPQTEIQKEEISLSGGLLMNELEAQFLSTAEDEDEYIETANVGDSVFTNPEDADQFEILFGGGLDLAYNEVLGEEEE